MGIKLTDLFAIIYSVYSEKVAIYTHTFGGHLILPRRLSNKLWALAPIAQFSYAPLSNVGCPLLVGMFSSYFHTVP